METTTLTDYQKAHLARLKPDILKRYPNQHLPRNDYERDALEQCRRENEASDQRAKHEAQRSYWRGVKVNEAWERRKEERK